METLLRREDLSQVCIIKTTQECCSREGNLDATVMLIGEAPGYWEDIKGRPPLWVQRARFLMKHCQEQEFPEGSRALQGVPDPQAELEKLGWLRLETSAVKPQLGLSANRVSLGSRPNKITFAKYPLLVMIDRKMLA